jgi:hypothetical protein
MFPECVLKVPCSLKGSTENALPFRKQLRVQIFDLGGPQDELGALVPHVCLFDDACHIIQFVFTKAEKLTTLYSFKGISYRDCRIIQFYQQKVIQIEKETLKGGLRC